MLSAAVVPAVILVTWFALTSGASPFVQPDFLPSPTGTLKGFFELYFDYQLLSAIKTSAIRILIAFGLSAAVALPLGIAMGAFTPIQSALDPVFAPLRYMPITAFIPLLILWFGIY